MHVPYQHKRATQLMLEVAKHVKVSEIVILGDLADFYFASGHGPKTPYMLNTTVSEVEAVNEFLDSLDKNFKDAKKKYIEGNHEFRLTRFIQNKAPELFGYVDAQALFKIQSRPGWSWIHYGPNQRTQVLKSKLFARHEPFGSSAKATAARALCSLVYGHIHRIESSYVVGLDGKSHIAFSVGWLGDSRKDEVFGYVKGHAQWQLGFGLVWVDEKTGLFYPQAVQILPHGNSVSCVVNGKRFVA